MTNYLLYFHQGVILLPLALTNATTAGFLAYESHSYTKILLTEANITIYYHLISIHSIFKKPGSYNMHTP